ncbi:MAG: hypothetical protein HY922_17515 [Elusimicrobia bacterium]|nr:hypothetical protein [Elusimicrobiota bacterium]
MTGGKSLAQWIEEGRRFTEFDILALALDAARELEALHAASKRAHGGLSPETLRLSEDGRVSLDKSLPKPGACSGFSAPELAAPASDVYSLGAVIVYALTQQAPAQPRDAGALIRIVKGLNLSKRFKAVLERMLCANPKRRYKDGAALRKALSDVLAGGHPRKLLMSLIVLSFGALAWLAYRYLPMPWDGKRPFKRFAHGRASFVNLAFSPDGTELLFSADNEVLVWDTRTWADPHRIVLPSLAPGCDTHGFDMVFDPNRGSLIIGAGTDPHCVHQKSAIFFWGTSARTSIPRKLEMDGILDSISLRPDGSRLAVALNTWDKVEQQSWKGRIKIFSLNKNTGVSAVIQRGPIRNVKFTPDGAILYASEDWNEAEKRFDRAILFLHTPSSGKDDMRIIKTEDIGELSSLTVSPTGRFFVYPDKNSERFRVVNRSGRFLRTLAWDSAWDWIVDGNTDWYWKHPSGAFSRDGALFAAPISYRHRQMLEIWDTNSWKRIKRLNAATHLYGPQIAAVTFSPDRRILAACIWNYQKSEILLWRITP